MSDPDREHKIAESHRTVQDVKRDLSSIRLIYDHQETVDYDPEYYKTYDPEHCSVEQYFIVALRQEHMDAILAIPRVPRDEERGRAYGYPETALKGRQYLVRCGVLPNFFTPETLPKWVAICPFYPTIGETESGFLPNEEAIGKAYEQLLKQVAPELYEQRVAQFLAEDFWGEEFWTGKSKPCK